MSWPISQFGPIPGAGLATIAGGVVGVEPGATGGTYWVPRSCTHRVKLFWHLTEQLWTSWTTLLFGMSVPARLVALEENRIVAATPTFICTLLKTRTLKVCAQLNELASSNSR